MDVVREKVRFQLVEFDYANFTRLINQIDHDYKVLTNHVKEVSLLSYHRKMINKLLQNLMKDLTQLSLFEKFYLQIRPKLSGNVGSRLSLLQSVFILFQEGRIPSENYRNELSRHLRNVVLMKFQKKRKNRDVISSIKRIHDCFYKINEFTPNKSLSSG